MDSFQTGIACAKEDIQNGYPLGDILASWNALRNKGEIHVIIFASGYFCETKMSEPEQTMEMERIRSFLNDPFNNCETFNMTREEIISEYKGGFIRFNGIIS